MLKPIYDKNIIVGIKTKDKMDWYILDKQICFLEGNDIKFQEDTKEIRKNFPILSENNIHLFLEKIDPYKMNKDKIRLAILETMEKKEDLEDYYPVILIDFEKRIFYSQYPEPVDYENYLPQNWKEEYTDFSKYIPEEKQYWKYKGKNLFDF